MQDIVPKECAFAVMAKAPRPGHCKTRLCPPLDHQQAAQLGAAFLRDITENLACVAQTASVAAYVAYAPAGTERLLEQHVATGTGLLLADGTQPTPPNVTGFGRSLLQAIETMLALGHGSAVVLNSDSPTLPTSILRTAVQALSNPGEHVVLGPAEDGGYYLLGMKTPLAHLFSDIAWSTAGVVEMTRQRAREIGVEVIELPVWYDVDDHPSLRRLLQDTTLTQRANRPGTALEPYSARFTARALRNFGLSRSDRATG